MSQWHDDGTFMVAAGIVDRWGALSKTGSDTWNECVRVDDYPPIPYDTRYVVEQTEDVSVVPLGVYVSRDFKAVSPSCRFSGRIERDVS